MPEIPARPATAPGARRAARRLMDRRIANLAFPALGALIVEPLFLAVDAAMVGHLGAPSLAGLAIAAAVLQTAVGLMIFLAYSTTPLVARRRAAGDLRGAVQAGIDGLWLATGIGIAVGLAVWLVGPGIVAAFNADPVTARQALEYLTVSCLGIPAMLLVFAASGLLRGMQDTRTPLAVAAVGFGVNALLNWWFIYGLELGLAGSAWGTVAAQWGMVAAYVAVIARHATRAGAGFRPHRDGLSRVGRTGGWLFIRTLGLRVALLATVFAATSHGTVTVAAYQVVFTMFGIAAFALDALAIAAQALVGDALGARNAARARFIVRRTILWGLIAGAGMGIVIAALSPVLGRVFTGDEAVLEILPAALVVLGLSLPLGAFVFVLDGVLMGAGDARYLAWTSLLNVAGYLPVLWLLLRVSDSSGSALVALTVGFTFAFMAARAITLGWRARGDGWVVLGTP